MKKYCFIFLIGLMMGCTPDREFPEKSYLHTLKQTQFAYTLSQPIDLDKNQIYSPTLLYAWNHLKDKTNTHLSKGTDLSRIIDQSKDHLSSLKENEYTNKITVEGPQITVTSEFSKSLPFTEEFSNNNLNLKFNGRVSVESFGCDKCQSKIREQISVLYYKNNNDFIVKLTPSDTTNEIILYKSPEKQRTLKKHYVDLQNTIQQKKSQKDWWRYHFLEEDILEIPILNFNIQSTIDELIGNKLVSETNTLIIEDAMQRIALILDEKGAEVESEAVIVAKATSIEFEPQPKRLIFDKPFLLVMKKKEMENPYLLVWVNNEELMQVRK